MKRDISAGAKFGEITSVLGPLEEISWFLFSRLRTPILSLLAECAYMRSLFATFSAKSSRYVSCSSSSLLRETTLCSSDSVHRCVLTYRKLCVGSPLRRLLRCDAAGGPVGFYYSEGGLIAVLCCLQESLLLAAIFSARARFHAVNHLPVRMRICSTYKQCLIGEIGRTL